LRRWVAFTAGALIVLAAPTILLWVDTGPEHPEDRVGDAGVAPKIPAEPKARSNPRSSESPGGLQPSWGSEAGVASAPAATPERDGTQGAPTRDVWRLHVPIDPGTPFDPERQRALVLRDACSGEMAALLRDNVPIEYVYMYATSAGPQTLRVAVPPSACR